MLFMTEFNNAFTMAVTHSSCTSNNELDDDNDTNDDASGNDAARPIAGPSKRRRTSPEVSSMDEESSEIEDGGRPLSGPPSGIPSTIEGDFSDDEEPNVGGDADDSKDCSNVRDDEDGNNVGDDEDPDAKAACIDADLVASVGNE